MTDPHDPQSAESSSAPPPPGPTEAIPPQGVPGVPVNEDAKSKKILCGVLAILLGSLGVHKFILGYTTPGIIMAVVTVAGYALSFLCLPLIAPLAMWGIGIAEGIIYLTKTDAEFKATYIDGKKEWF